MPSIHRKEWPLSMSNIPDTLPARPQTLLQRVSSGLISVLPKRSPRKESRLMTAPLPHDRTGNYKIQPREIVVLKAEDKQTSQISIPKLSDPNAACPHDSHIYHSFPAFKESGCDLCGMKVASRASWRKEGVVSPGRRNPEQLSDFTLSFTLSRQDRRASSIQDSRSIYESVHTLQFDPHIIPARSDIKKSGSPPRFSPLPPDCVPVYSSSSLAKRRKGKKNQKSRLSSHQLRPHAPTGPENPNVPRSPKLHHLRALPHSSQFPYVHKHEVDSHLAALRAGASSPLRQYKDKCASVSDFQEPSEEFLQTVFYGHTVEPADPKKSLVGRAISPAESLKDERLAKEVHVIRTVIGEDGKQDGAALAVTSQNPPQRTETDMFYGETQQTPSTVGGHRLELKGGSSSTPPIPRLRGGSEEQNLLNHRVLYRHWILTCPKPCRVRLDDTDSTNELFPPRILGVETVAKLREQGQKAARVPEISLSRSWIHGKEAEAPLGSSTQAKPSELTIPRLSREKYLGTITKHSQIDSLVWNTITKRKPSVPMPSIRGGAEDLSSDNKITVPPTLYWLAGGQGKSISLGSWQKERAKRRMGGLLGLAIYGDRAGTNFVKEKEDAEEDIEVGSDRLSALHVDIETSVQLPNDGGCSSHSGSTAMEGCIRTASDSSSPSSGTTVSQSSTGGSEHEEVAVPVQQTKMEQRILESNLMTRISNDGHKDIS